MAAIPVKRSKTPEPDLETGISKLKPEPEKIEVSVVKEAPPKSPFADVMFPKHAMYGLTTPTGKGRKSRKQKKRVSKKTQKRRGRK